ncbi:MAG: hypothetical protein AAGU27_15265 [Dehalobacterium sp.]
MEENKIVELIEKIYSEMQEGFKDARAEMQEGLKGVRAEMQEGLKGVRAEMQEGLKGVRAEMQEGLKGVRAEMQEGLKGVRAEMQEGLKGVRDEMQEGFSEARKDRARIEYTLMQKIDIIADGVIQNTNRLDRLEVRVSNVEELIKERSIIVPKDYYVKLLKKVENE